jgi:hypothetical protein
MVERISPEQTLAACFIESDETHNQIAGRGGLRECNGLLVRNAACTGIHWNVRQAMLFNAAFITGRFYFFR